MDGTSAVHVSKWFVLCGSPTGDLSQPIPTRCDRMTPCFPRAVIDAGTSGAAWLLWVDSLSWLPAERRFCGSQVTSSTYQTLPCPRHPPAAQVVEDQQAGFVPKPVQTTAVRLQQEGGGVRPSSSHGSEAHLYCREGQGDWTGSTSRPGSGWERPRPHGSGHRAASLARPLLVDRDQAVPAPYVQHSRESRSHFTAWHA